MNHSHGYHGSDKGRCLFCGSFRPESEHCKERTKSEQQANEWHDKQVAIVRALVKRLSSEEKDALNYITGSTTLYQFGLLEEFTK